MKFGGWVAVSQLALFSVAIGQSAAAQQGTGFAADHFNPSERGSHWFALDSLDLRGRGRIALGAVTSYSYRSVVDYRGDGVVQDSIVRNQVTTYFGGAVTFLDRVRVGLTVPQQFFADGHDAHIRGSTYPAPSEAVAVGDVRIATDVRLVGEYNDRFTAAIGAQYFAPSGDPRTYTGDGKPRFMPHFLLAGLVGRFTYSGQIALQVRGRDEPYGDGRIGTEAIVAVAAGLSLMDHKLTIGPELFGSTVLSKGSALENRTTPIEALLGAHYDLPWGFRIGAGAGAGVTHAYGAPIGRALLTMEWVADALESPAECVMMTDRDGDGISDMEDACSFAPGPHSDDPAKNGCPLADADNGCPADGDKDGVVDREDACPSEAGVKSLDPKKNGCPERDRDGCPDPDTDKDGILNDVDACPNQPGKPDPDPKKNGCPKAFLQGGEIKITDQVKFKTGSAQILPGKESEEILQAVLSVVKAHPEVTKMLVSGHTDSTGNPTANKSLSLARADSVVIWLTSHGVDKSLLQSEGFGSERPIDSNETDLGRKNNRRVEFHVEGENNKQ